MRSWVSALGAVPRGAQQHGRLLAPAGGGPRSCHIASGTAWCRLAPPPPLDEAARASFCPRYERTKEAAPLNDDARLVDAHHRAYVDALLGLYQAHKDAQWNAPGLKREESLKIAK